ESSHYGTLPLAEEAEATLAASQWSTGDRTDRAAHPVERRHDDDTRSLVHIGQTVLAFGGPIDFRRQRVQLPHALGGVQGGGLERPQPPVEDVENAADTPRLGEADLDRLAFLHPGRRLARLPPAAQIAPAHDQA